MVVARELKSMLLQHFVHFCRPLKRLPVFLCDDMCWMIFYDAYIDVAGKVPVELPRHDRDGVAR